jgi:hypothetical protein
MGQAAFKTTPVSSEEQTRTTACTQGCALPLAFSPCQKHVHSYKWPCSSGALKGPVVNAFPCSGFLDGRCRKTIPFDELFSDSS